LATYQNQRAEAGRQLFPDLARAFALFGIAIVNVSVFAYPFMEGYSANALAGPLDKSAAFSTYAFFLAKSYTLFSFMFGVGFAYQMVSAERRGTRFDGEFWRRIIALVVLGVLHVALLFTGDILFVYGVLGAFLLLFRKASAKTLVRWAIGLYIAQVAVMGLVALAMWAGDRFAPEVMAVTYDELALQSKAAYAAFGEGSFMDATRHRLMEWGTSVPLFFLMQGVGALSFFLFGLAAVRNGLIENPSAPFWGKCRRIYLPIGLVGSALAAWVMATADSPLSCQGMIGVALVFLFSPFSTAGYLGLIAAWAASPHEGVVKTFLARGGTASLTAYLLQSVFFSLIFSAYGLGFFGELGAFTCLVIALGVAAITLSLSSLWRSRFKLGPMEMVLRRWTYLGKGPRA
jgi:uncharacterized protein